MPIEPCAHPRGLLEAFRREATSEIRFARFGFGMTPEDQVHGRVREMVGKGRGRELSG
jgi:hypothetical protein